MKTRNGFVSNSSSSSFIITFDEIYDIDFDNVDLIEVGDFIIGRWLSEGVDYFEVTKEMKNYFCKNRDMFYLYCMKLVKNPEIKQQDEDLEYTIKQEDVGKKITFFEKDYYNSIDLDDIIARYKG